MAPTRLLGLLFLLGLRLSADCVKAAAAGGTKDPAVRVDLLAGSAPRGNDPVLVTPRSSDRRKGHLVVQPGTALLSNSSSLGDTPSHVPDRLDARDAGSGLTFPIRGPDLSGISQERRSLEQAATSLEAIPAATAPNASVPAAVLQSLQGCWARELPAAELLALVEVVRSGREVLSGTQLSCLAKLLAARNLTASASALPPDVLLFLDLSAVHNRSCKAFYALASRGNLELLPRGSLRRMRLLRGALACWGASGPALSAEQLGGLGALVCDMEPVTVTASHPRVLENLKLCRALSRAQRDALNAVLLTGATAYGHPSSWDVRSLHSLGTLVLSLNQTVLRSLAEEVRRALRRRIAATYRGQDSVQQHRSRVLLGALASIKVLSSPRRRIRRSAGRCPSVPITAGALADPLLLLSYESSEEFDLCLDERVLRSSLALLLEQPLTAGFLRVVQRRLGQIYPEGIPEEQLKLLGPLSHLYTPEEISTWTVTSNATLLALLNPRVGKWTAPQAQQLITRYLDLGGILTGSLLQSIGGSTLCRLDEEHISCITPEAIGCAGPLDISSCSQAKKNQLYAKAQEAFASQAGTPAYYSLIQPYLGGAPAKDLKELAKTGISMDIDTFTALNPEELQQLSVTDVKNLLGINLPDLKQVENLPAVINWIRRQDQWELDHILGIGLQGGIVKPSPTGSATSVAVTPSITVVPTTAVLATTALPAGTTTSSHTAMGSSTSTHVSPTPNAITLTPPHAQSTLSSAGGSLATTSRVTTRPALLPSSTSPCSVHPATTSMTTRSPVSALPTTTPTAVPPSTISPHPALTGGTITAPTPRAVTTSTPAVPINPPAAGGTANPAPSTLNATTAANITPQKPTPMPRTSISTQKSVTNSTVKTTTLACQTGAPQPFLSPSSTTTSTDTTKKAPTDVPKPPNPTPVGYINLQPDAGSGSRLSSCSLHMLAAALGISLLQGLL